MMVAPEGIVLPAIDLQRLADDLPTRELDTARLTLRSLQPGDRARELEMASDLETLRFVREPEDRRAIIERVDRYFAPWVVATDVWTGLAIAPRGGADHIGLVSLLVRSDGIRRVEIGYRLQAESQGQGYAQEAARALMSYLFGFAGAHSICARCDVDNRRSYALMERLGLRREGRLRENDYLNGRWRDNYVYAIVASEFLLQASAIPSTYLLISSADRAAAHNHGVYLGSESDLRDGFIHLSTAAQVEESARKHRSGEQGLMLARVPTARISHSLRWEPSRGGDLFPHLYGSLPWAAVDSCVPLPFEEATGSHRFPRLDP